MKDGSGNSSLPNQCLACEASSIDTPTVMMISGIGSPSLRLRTNSTSTSAPMQAVATTAMGTARPSGSPRELKANTPSMPPSM